MDRRRGSDPIMGRKADETMMALCQFLKDHRKELAPAKVDRAIATIKKLNLRPYWNYCREHLLDIGLEF